MIKNETCYCRKCPSCKRVLYYSNKYKLQRAISKNSMCYSCSKIGIIQSQETRQKRSNSLGGHNYYKSRIGVKHSDERKVNISKSMRGRRLTEEHKKKISLSNKGKKKTADHIHNFMLGCEKSLYKRKPYILGNETVLIQGYENLSLDKLISESIPISEIKVKIVDKPRILYLWNGKEHWYYPDCYLSNSNTIVETKSDWTWKSCFEKNQEKIKSSQNYGYNVRVIIWNGKKELVSDTTYKSQYGV